MNFIKRNWKILLLILCIGLGVFCYYLWESNRELKRDKERLEQNLSLNQKEIRDVKNRAGELTQQVESYRMKADELERTNLEQFKTLQKFSKDVEKIESYMKIVTQAVGQIKTPLRDSIIFEYKPDLDGLVVIDTTSIKKFKFNDNYLNLDGYLIKDTLYSDYKYTSKLEGVMKWESQGFFKDDKLVLQVKSENPNETIIGLESIKIEQPDKKLWEKTSFKIGSGVVIGVAATVGLFSLIK